MSNAHQRSAGEEPAGAAAATAQTQTAAATEGAEEVKATTGKIMKCWNCGRLYRFYAHMVGDQTVCAKCRAEAERQADQS